MRILSIHDGHNAAAAVLKDGVVTFAIQEERLGRSKNFFGWPERAIAAALAYEGWKPADVERVALTSHFISAPMGQDEVKSRFGWQGSPTAVMARKISGWAPIREYRERQSLDRRIAFLTAMGIGRDRITVVDHHECHAASAYFGLRTDDDPYLVLTLDGGGDWRCATVSIGARSEMKLVSETEYGNSLGDVYSRVTFMMGFTPWEHEYKLMGMAPYASRKYSEVVADKLRGYLDLDPNDSKRFRRRIDEPTNHLVPRLERDMRRQRFDSIAGGIQLFTEDLLVRWVRACVKATGVSRVLAAGGVFMNIKANKLISELPEITSFEAFPSCGDETNVFGGGWLVARRFGDTPAPLKHFYMGGSFDDTAAAAALEKETAAGGITVERLADVNLQTARWLADGHIVARASGRMEFGARALGNRSILADPSRPAIIPIINALIKSRDFWMPFAPLTRLKGSERYIHNPKSLHSPYMMMGFDAMPTRTEFVAGVHPADGSARMQLLEPGQNPDIEQVVEHFESITGRGVLLNTSYNLHGFPIAHTPEEALYVFRNSGLTHLVLGGYGVVKTSAPAK